MKVQSEDSAGTESFFFRLVAAKSKSLCTLIFIGITVISWLGGGLLTGCGSLRTRDSMGQERSSPADRGTPLPSDGTAADRVEGTDKESGTVGSEDETEGVPPLTPTPEFLRREPPKVGVILGPGGMKAYAHLGVLREFARLRIPIHAIVGLEWGAVIGGLYALQGQVNEAEWKSFKLKAEDVSAETGFLSSKLKPGSVAGLGDFLNTTFSSASTQSTKILFSCPTYYAPHHRLIWLTRGPLKASISKCLPYPPLFRENSGYLASPFVVREAAEKLKARGAQVVVLVNVLGSGEILPAALAKENYTENLLWSELRREMLRHRTSVDWVVAVNTGGHAITDLEGRRALMESGGRAAASVISKFAARYGF